MCVCIYIDIHGAGATGRNRFEAEPSGRDPKLSQIATIECIVQRVKQQQAVVEASSCEVQSDDGRRCDSGINGTRPEQNT